MLAMSWSFGCNPVVSEINMPIELVLVPKFYINADRHIKKIQNVEPALWIDDRSRRLDMHDAFSPPPVV